MVTDEFHAIGTVSDQIPVEISLQIIGLFSEGLYIGHGAGYRYPHDDPAGWVEQDYLPEELRGTRYYEPSEHGQEAEIAARLRRRGDLQCESRPDERTSRRD